MTTTIHPTAIVESSVQLGENVYIGPFCHLSGDVQLADRVKLMSHVVVAGRTFIGEGSEVYPFASLGHRPQDLKYHGEASTLIIGARNMIREYVTMQPGTEGGGMKTVVGDDGLFMAGSHVAHDCFIGNHVILANNATLAGHVIVEDYVIIGGLSAVLQFVRIGRHAIVGGMSGVAHDVLPFAAVKGEQAFLSGLNLIGLRRRGMQREDIYSLKKAYELLFTDVGTLEERVNRLAEQAQSEYIEDLVRFLRGNAKHSLMAPKEGFSIELASA